MDFVTGNILNILVFVIMLGCGILVARDAHKLGRSRREVIAWGIFSAWFIVVGPIFYLFFRSKFYK